MFKTTSFNLVNDEEERKFEKLYDPKRCRWMRYIVIPALIGFALLLVLVNIDFSAHSHDKHTTTAITTSPSYSSTTRKRTLAKPINENGDDIMPSIYRAKLSDQLFCNSNCCDAINLDYCNIKCEDGWVRGLKEDLENMQEKCGKKNYLQVTITGYAATNSILKRENLNGNFYIKNLILEDNYGIKIIEDQAFNCPSMATLGTLKIISHELISKINGNTFLGLNNLTEFHITRTSFDGEGFLQPLAQSLQKLIIGTESSTTYDPTNWFQGDSFESLLHVELSRSKFAHSLRKETFEKLSSVKELYLMSCDITSIADGTFDFIANTLETLDLRDNQLVTLDVTFLQSIHGILRLELSANSWDCSRENYPLIEAFKNNPKIVYSADEPPMCTAPPKDKKKLFTEIYLPLHVECNVNATAVTSSSAQTSTDYPKPNTPKSTTSSTTKLATTPTKPTEATSADYPTPNTPKSTAPSNTVPDAPSTKPTVTISTAYPTPNRPKSTIPPITKPNLPSTTTERTENILTLQCKTHSSASEASQSSGIEIRNYDALFSIVSETQQSVRVTFDSDINGLHLIYFKSKSNSYVNTNLAFGNTSTESQLKNASTSEIIIQGLTPAQLYVFCLMPDDKFETSPLNCLSHIVKVVAVLPRYVWLSKNDLAWAVPVLIIGIMLFVCCGVAAIYFLLRWRPTWLRGSKRIIRKESSSFEVYLVPKKPKSREMSGPNNILDIKSFDHMQFCKDLRRSQTIQTPHEKVRMPPYDPAPSLPNRTESNASTVLMEVENDYQSLSCYELLY